MFIDFALLPSPRLVFLLNDINVGQVPFYEYDLTTRTIPATYAFNGMFLFSRFVHADGNKRYFNVENFAFMPSKNSLLIQYDASTDTF